MNSSLSGGISSLGPPVSIGISVPRRHSRVQRAQGTLEAGRTEDVLMGIRHSLRCCVLRPLCLGWVKLFLATPPHPTPPQPLPFPCFSFRAAVLAFVCADEHDNGDKDVAIGVCQAEGFFLSLARFPFRFVFAATWRGGERPLCVVVWTRSVVQ